MDVEVNVVLMNSNYSISTGELRNFELKVL